MQKLKRDLRQRSVQGRQRDENRDFDAKEYPFPPELLSREEGPEQPEYQNAHYYQGGQSKGEFRVGDEICSNCALDRDDLARGGSSNIHDVKQRLDLAVHV